MKTTLSILKADVGSIGGHTKPSHRMLESVRSDVNDAISRGLLIDAFVGHTGDDICIVSSHTRGENDTEVHQFAWNAFLNATAIASQYGLYGAGQDLLVDAPSGNIRGAGPAVAEIEWEHDPVKTNPVRPAESFMVLAADKCGPGAYNLPMFLGFADPMYCAGLMLPRLSEGFTFNIIDMDNTDGDSLISLNAPEDYYKMTVLLRDNERFAIESIVSRHSGAGGCSNLGHSNAQHRRHLHRQGRPGGPGSQSRRLPRAGRADFSLHQGSLHRGRRPGLPRYAADAGSHQHGGNRDVLPAAGFLRGLSR